MFSGPLQVAIRSPCGHGLWMGLVFKDKEACRGSGTGKECVRIREEPGEPIETEQGSSGGRSVRNSQEFVSGSWCRTTTGGILNSSFSHLEGGSRPPLPCEEKGGGPRRGGAEKRGGLCVWLGRALLVVTQESPVPPPPPPREKNHNFEGFCSYTCPESCFLHLFLFFF